MNKPKPSIRRQTFRQLLRAVMMFLKSPVGVKAKWLAASLLVLMLSINGLNVLNSYVGRYFMSSIERRDTAGFVHYAWLYIGVFAVSTLIAAFFRFSEERLGLLWRNFLTHRIVGAYIDQRLFLRLENAGGISNPDQRITEDVKQLTTTTLSFLLMLLNGTVTAISFSGVLWTISPKLFVIAVVYAVAGSALTVLLGRPLIRLNYRQSDFEANFRAELIRVRENAEGIALTSNERRIRERLVSRIDDLVGNLKHIIRVNLNLNFFTGGYNYMIQLIPTLIVAPMFMRHGVEFGVIIQAGMAFATLLGAFSLVVTQFQAISSYASVITRLVEFVEAAEIATVQSKASRIEYSTGNDHFTYSKVTLRTNDHDGSVLLNNLNLSLVAGKRVLVYGSSHAARTALFRASAGLYDSGSGNIVHPSTGKVAFLPERPYLAPTTLGELLAPSGSGHLTWEEKLDALREIGLESMVKKHDGIELARNWLEILSLEEQQRLSVTRVILAKPRFAFLDQLDSALSDAEYERVLTLLANHGITCISFGDHAPDPARHDACLELHDDGSWTWKELR
jgi:putative ATP-binding cassette transporter